MEMRIITEAELAEMEEVRKVMEYVKDVMEPEPLLITSTTLIYPYHPTATTDDEQIGGD